MSMSMVRWVACLFCVVLLASACKKTSASPPTPAASRSVPAVAPSASAFPSASAAVAVGAREDTVPPDLAVLAGKTPGGVVTGGFAVRALTASGGPFRKSVEACAGVGKFVCSETAWERACATSPELGKGEAWTYSIDQGKLVVRGGDGGCTGRRLVEPSDESAARATLCCDRVVGVKGGDEQVAGRVADELVVFERCVRERKADELASVTAEKLLVSGQSHAREQALPALLAALLPDAGADVLLIDTCELGVAPAAPSTTAEPGQDVTCLTVRLGSPAVESVIWRFKTSGSDARLSCMDFGDAPVSVERKQRVGGFLSSGH